MSAFIEPPENSHSPADLPYVASAWTGVLPPPETERLGACPPIVAWKTWALVGWMVLAAMGSVVWTIRATF
jgi:hypothetical protein